MDKRLPGVAGRGSRRLPAGMLAGICTLALGLLVLVGCAETAYAQTIRITAEPVNVAGLFARVEYLRDGEVVSSVHLVDGNGDGVIDGKSGPVEEGKWPDGWEWFDNMYEDVVVGQSTMMFDGLKVVVTEVNEYEFIVGEYECRSRG